MVQFEDLVLYNRDVLPKFLSENEVTPEIKEEIRKTLMKEVPRGLYNSRR